MKIADIRFTGLFKIIAIGWTLGVTVIYWTALTFGYLLSLMGVTGIVDSRGNSISSSFSVTSGFVLAPVIGFLQSVIFTIVCYFGIFLFRKIMRL